MIPCFTLITILTSTSFYCNGCCFPKKFQKFEKVETPPNNQTTISNETMLYSWKKNNEWSGLVFRETVVPHWLEIIETLN